MNKDPKQAGIHIILEKQFKEICSFCHNLIPSKPLLKPTYSLLSLNICFFFSSSSIPLNHQTPFLFPLQKHTKIQGKHRETGIPLQGSGKQLKHAKLQPAQGLHQIESSSSSVVAVWFTGVGGRGARGELVGGQYVSVRGEVYGECVLAKGRRREYGGGDSCGMLVAAI